MSDQPVLGEDNTVVELNGSEEMRATALELARQATRHLYIYSQHLDHALFDNEAFVEACSELARANPRSEIRVLVKDSDKAVKSGHRLVNLGQRLSSSIQFRVPGSEYAGFGEAFIVSDDIGYLRRPLADRFEGEANFNDRLKAHNLGNFFREVWEKAQRDPQLHRLQI